MPNKIKASKLFEKSNSIKFFLKKIHKIIIFFLIYFVKIYQIILSPFISHNKCRFNPSCSNYMIEAIAKKGAVKGLAKGIWRLCRCNPLFNGGDDFIK